jgi:hypothetical protein
MSRSSLRRPGRKPKVAWVAAALASMLILLTVENIWIDPWTRHKSHRIPSLVPEAQSGTWFLAFTVIATGLMLLILCLILLLRDRGAPLWTKLGVGIAVVLVLLLSGDWFRVTNGQPELVRLLTRNRTHKIVLTWQASGSPVVGYNIYRKTIPGAYFVRLNASTVHGLTYTDDAVDSGVIYYYAARAVDAKGGESVDSNISSVTVP